jgi:hypothetical protein
VPTGAPNIPASNFPITESIPLYYQGQPVRFNSDGWLDATAIAKRYGKKPAHWLELPATQSYMAALARRLGGGVNVGKSDILNVGKSHNLVWGQRGRAGGTWLHPKMAVAFAR